MRRRRLAPMGAVSFLVLCASVFMPGVSGVASAGSDIPAPPGLPSFYSVPQPLPSGKAGTLIKDEVVSDPNLVGATLYVVMYKSKGPRNKLVPVTGMVAVPDGTPPAGRVAGGELGSRDQRHGRHLRPEPAGNVAGPRDERARGGRLRGHGQRLPGRGDPGPDALHRRCVGGRGHGRSSCRRRIRFPGSR